MFSRLLHTAKSYISPPPPPVQAIAAITSPDESKPSPAAQPSIAAETKTQTQTKPLTESAKKSTPRRKTRIHSPDSNMVTTRQSLQDSVSSNRKKDVDVEQEFADENSINVHVPGTATTSSAKSTGKGKGKKRAIVGEEENGTPSRSAKKRKVSSASLVDESEGVLVKSSRLVVEIPVTREMRESAEKAQVEKVADNAVAEKLAKEAETVKKVHKKFDSDDEGEEQEFFSTARDEPVVEPAEEKEEEESDDDEAPEEVGAQSAKLEAKVQVESAKSAIQSLKKKRKDRATKAQSLALAKSTSKPKSKPNTEIDATLAEMLPEPSLQSGSESEGDSSDLDSDEEESDTELTALSKSKRTAFDLPVQPKDRRVGSTVYRVVKEPERNLAPKVGKRAKDTKEDWLKGRNGKAGLGATRKAVRKSFC